MRKISIAAIMGAVLFMANCSTEQNPEGLLDAVNRYLDGEFNLCQTNSLSDLPDSDVLTSFLDSCYVKSVDEKGVVLSVPDYTSVIEVLREDTYFASIRDNPELAQEYFCSVLKSEETKKDISWRVDWDGAGLGDGRALQEAALEVVNGDVVMDTRRDNTMGNNGAFVFTMDGNKVLVSSIKVLVGQEAISRLYSTGIANKNYGVPVSGEVFFVSYKVTNLSNGRLNIPPLFTVVSDGKIVENLSDYVGLSQEVDLSNAESAELMTFMAGPAGSSVYFIYDGAGMPIGIL